VRTCGGVRVKDKSPLAVFFLISTVPEALMISVAVTGVALLMFGAVKGYLTGHYSAGVRSAT
jgi:VIT1/CCC1 family predicted Fe2+/Mn2+ transporter